MLISTRARAVLAAASAATAVFAGAVAVHAQGGTAPTVVPVTVDNGKGPVLAATIAPGPTTFTVSTTSKTADQDSPELTLVSVAAGKDPVALAAEFKKANSSPATIEAALKREGSAIIGEGSADKGHPRSFTVDLPAGTYLALNTTQDKKLPYSSFTVGGAANGASLPTAQTTIKMDDYGYAFSGALHRGSVEKIMNVGKTIHMLVAFKVADAKAARAVKSGLKMGKGDPEKLLRKYVRGEGHAGIGVLSPGGVEYKTVQDAPGTYVAVCFWQSSAKAKPHFMLGMERSYTVK